ncbi:hypothetical protein ZWY2020_036159 [Hordeum vulgare]|nr:hypothetical protein ZWY2020_036159 [Hordeum vulgare]
MEQQPSVRDWSELPLDALTLVFAGLGAVDVLMGAGLVCRSWLEAAKGPELWRKVDMGRGPRDKEVMLKNRDDSLDHSMFRKVVFGRPSLCEMAKVAVNRSNGRLEEFAGSNFVTDEILNYIGARSPSLKRLALLTCYHVTSQGFTNLLTNCPLLEDIEVSGCVGVRGDAMVATGRACLRLKWLVLDKTWRRRWDRGEVASISMMHELRHLSLACCEITNDEPMAVVDACPCLDYLSVVNCYNIVTDDALRAKCATVKTLELPTSQDHHYDWDEFYAYE